MIVKLIRHSFPDRPQWIIIDEDIPLGTEYEVFGYDADMMISSCSMHEVRPVDCFFVQRIDNKERGWLPCICFRD